MALCRPARKARLLAVATAALLGLTACGGGGQPAEQASPAPAASEGAQGAQSEAPQAAAAETGPFGDLKEAATHTAEMTAPALAMGISQAANIEGVDTDGAKLRRALSAELQEHVYLAAIALEQDLLGRTDAFQAAAAALDENSVELADLVGSVAPDQRDAFLQLWRDHIGFFVEYTDATKAGNEQGKQAAADKLNQYRADAGAFFEMVTGGALPADTVASSLETHVNTVLQTVDAFASGSPGGFDQLHQAAHHTSDETGPALATGVAQATGMQGVDSPGALLLTNLSTALQEHVYLTGVFVEQALSSNQPAAMAAQATLDRNSVELADLVGSVAPDQRDAFLQLWRDHIGFFATYTQGVAAGDQAMKDQALAQLAQYQQDAGMFFEMVTGGALPADAVASSLDTHVKTTVQAIDGLAQALGVTGS